MKNIYYSLSDSDIETILFTLSIFPSLELEKTKLQATLNLQYCISAAEKLSNHIPDMNSNELRVVSASLEVARLINQGELKVDSEIKNECSRYLFSINKLSSFFKEQLS